MAEVIIDLVSPEVSDGGMGPAVVFGMEDERVGNLGSSVLCDPLAPPGVHEGRSWGLWISVTDGRVCSLVFYPTCSPFPGSWLLPCFWLFFDFFALLGPHLQHVEVPRLGVPLELQLLATAIATTTWDPSRV